MVGGRWKQTAVLEPNNGRSPFVPCQPSTSTRHPQHPLVGIRLQLGTHRTLQSPPRRISSSTCPNTREARGAYPVADSEPTRFQYEDIGLIQPLSFRSQAEDSILLNLVNVHGAHNWVRISQAIQTRSPKQCRERFHQNLKPNLNHDPITPEEGLLIEQMVGEMGKRWAEIARRLRGRSDNAVKNWWNGGMNRRRRSNQQRRTELEVRQQPDSSIAPMQPRPMPPQQHPLPHGFTHMQPHYFTQPVYHPGTAHFPHSIRLPSNGPPLRAHGMVETPLPSPAYSQMSAEGPPSLMSDTSSMSARSPHHGQSPIELPPLSGARSERRQSSAPMLQLGVPGSFVHEHDYQMPTMHMQRWGDMEKAPPPRVLQEPFMPTQAFPHPNHYLPSQPRQPSPLQMGAPPPMPMHHQAKAMAQPYQPMPVQLPSISKMESQQYYGHSQIDPTFGQQTRCTPVPSAPTPDDSPKDKMSLSNLTH